MQALNLSDDHPVTVQAILKNSLSTSDYNKSFIHPLSIIVPQQGSTNSEDCPKALLCTEGEVFELIFGLECTKIYWT